MTQHKSNQKNLGKQLKIITKLVDDKGSLNRIKKYLRNIQQIYYYEHIYEQIRRINISLGLGDILITFIFTLSKR